MTPEERVKFQDDYVNPVLDSMDLKTLYIVAAESISGNLDSYSNEELTTEIKEYYPELLENV